MKTKDDKFYLIILCLVLGAAAYLYWPSLFVERLWSDEGLYSWQGLRIFQHPGLVFSREITEHHPPLFSITIALAHFFLPSEVACRFIPLFYYLLGIFLIYQLGAKIRDHFVGAFSATILAFNTAYFYCARHILLDIAFTTILMIFALCLLHFAQMKSHKANLWVALSGAAVILTKTGGYMALPILVVFYIFALKGFSIVSRLKFLAAPLLTMVLCQGLLIVKNILQLGEVHLGQGMVQYTLHPEAWDRIQSIPILIGAGWLVSLSVLWGLVRMPLKIRVLLYAWALVFTIAYVVLRLPLEIRFVLYIFPCLIVILAWSVADVFALAGAHSNFLTNMIQKVLVVTLGILLVIRLAAFREKLKSEDKYFVGYGTAGLKVKKIYHPGMLVLAGSERQMRYASGINYKEFGGDMVMLRQNEVEFEKLIKESTSDILLIIDQWERLQPAWAFPIRQKTMDYLSGLGFQLKDVAVRPHPLQDGLLGVVWVFMRPAAVVSDMVK